MGIISNTEAYMVATGKVRDYTETVANNCETVNIVIPKNGLQKIYLPQNSLLDSKKIRAIEVLTDSQVLRATIPGGTVGDVLESLAISAFDFTFAKDSENISNTPFHCMNRVLNSGKFYFLDSEPGDHRIGDSFINQIAALDAKNFVIVLRFWYD